MTNTSDQVEKKLLATGVVQFPPNVHGVYVERQESGNTVLTIRQATRECRSSSTTRRART